MFDISWLEVVLVLAAVLLILVGLAWAVALLLRLVRARRRPRGWDERVLGPDRSRD